MIYFLIGNDNKNKSVYTNELTNNGEVFFYSGNNTDKNLILSHSSNISLFGDSPSVVTENIFSEKIIDLSHEEFLLLKDSKTIFVIKEDKTPASEQKKYKKYGEVKIFEDKKIPSNDKFNVFSITDAFANKDKINTWILYNKAIESGVEPEAISGVLFWKIKMMILNGSRSFNLDELKNLSSSIVSLYHKAHTGEIDFYIGLEQFILNSLSSH